MSTRSRTRARAAVAAAVIAAALAGFFLLRDREERAPAAARQAAPAARPVAPRGPSAAAPDEAPDARRDPRPLALVAARVEPDSTSPAGSIEGRVVSDATGRGVAGAELTLALDGATTTLAADDGGGFRFRPEREGAVAIAAVTADGYLPFAPEWGHSPIELVARRGARVTDVVIYLAPATEWLGLVLGPDGSAVEGAEVRIVDTPAAEQELVAIADRFTTDRRGEFRFRAPEGAVLEARASGHGPARAAVDDDVRAARKLVLRLTAGDGGDLGSARITGVVVDGAGAPLAGVLVSARPETDGLELIAGGQALTGDDGRFAIERLDPRRYRVEARSQLHGAARARVALERGQVADLRLALTTGAALAGTVRDAAGVAVPAFTVVVSEAGALGTARPVVTRTFVDAEGNFAIGGLEPDGYTLQASAHGHAPSPRVEVDLVAPPAPPTRVSITVPAGGTLTGLVRAAGGGPIEGARVTTESGGADGSTAVPFSASTTTGADGRFTLRGLAPGRRSVVVTAASHHGVILGGLEVTEGAALGPIEVSLRPLAEGEEPTTDLVGIGAALSATADGLQVTQVIPGGGAAAAGLAVGDRIESIDGRSVVALGFEAAIQAIRGPIGTTVRLAVRRASSPDEVVELIVPRLQVRA